MMSQLSSAAAPSVLNDFMLLQHERAFIDVGHDQATALLRRETGCSCFLATYTVSLLGSISLTSRLHNPRDNGFLLLRAQLRVVGDGE
jgi:hypothetical protein